MSKVESIHHRVPVRKCAYARDRMRPQPPNSCCLRIGGFPRISGSLNCPGFAHSSLFSGLPDLVELPQPDRPSTEFQSSGTGSCVFDIRQERNTTPLPPNCRRRKPYFGFACLPPSALGWFSNSRPDARLAETAPRYNIGYPYYQGLFSKMSLAHQVSG